MERLQKTAEEQRTAAISPKPANRETGKPVDREIGKPVTGTSVEETSAHQSADLPTHQLQEEGDLWDRFEAADLDRGQTIFLNALEAGELDDEYAYEMLSSIRS